METNSPEIASVKQLLERKLCIPPYQRPYVWNERNVQELLSDLETAIDESKKYQGEFKYRVGSIILFKNKDKGLEEIVDGQQRCITLSLMAYAICKIRNKKGINGIPTIEVDKHYLFTSKSILNRNSQIHIQKNYHFIEDYLSQQDESYICNLGNALDKIVEVVVISVSELNEAFQLFDSQNSRGKALEPHDLLKAYHLREMKSDEYEMEFAVTKWESIPSEEISILFKEYLFRIIAWKRGEKSKTFTDQEIDTFKGITLDNGYSYAIRALKASPIFQIGEPFISGYDFFNMVSHYLELLKVVDKKIRSMNDINNILVNPEYTNSTGFRYAKTLFKCALLCYYDKFKSLNDNAVKKFFTWAMMLRVDKQSLAQISIENYAVGSENVNNTNCINVFYKIANARLEKDILCLQVAFPDTTGNSDKWKELLNQLKNLNHKE